MTDMKYLLTILITLMSFVSFSQEEDSLSYYTESASKIDTLDRVQFVYLSDTMNPYVVIYDEKVRVLFTIEEVQDINNTYQLIPYLEEVIEKYGIESSIEIGVVSSLENEIYILKQRLEDKDSRIADKDSVINEMTQTIINLKEQISKKDTLNSNKDEQIKNLEKQVRRQKWKTALVAIGEGAVIVLLVLVII